MPKMQCMSAQEAVMSFETILLQVYGVYVLVTVLFMASFCQLWSESWGGDRWSFSSLSCRPDLLRQLSQRTGTSACIYFIIPTTVIRVRTQLSTTGYKFTNALSAHRDSCYQYETTTSHRQTTPEEVSRKVEAAPTFTSLPSLEDPSRQHFPEVSLLPR